MIQFKRAYDPPAQTDGTRILVERPGPRGIKKDALRCTLHEGTLHDGRIICRRHQATNAVALRQYLEEQLTAGFVYKVVTT